MYYSSDSNRHKMLAPWLDIVLFTFSLYGSGPSKVTSNAQMFASASGYELRRMQSLKIMPYMYVPHHEQVGDVV
jgi:hypothetical protein